MRPSCPRSLYDLERDRRVSRRGFEQLLRPKSRCAAGHRESSPVREVLRVGEQWEWFALYMHQRTTAIYPPT